VKSATVKPGCIQATGLSLKRGRKGKQLFVLKKGTLSRYGYHLHSSDQSRHESLHRALQGSKPLSIFRKLNALYVLNKNRNPTAAKMYKADSEWVKTTGEYNL
jgi:hypothetical protein